MGYREAAQHNAEAGHNCCQSVFLAFCEEFGLDPVIGLKLSGGLGAGFSRRGEVCGAVSGAIMALGLQQGFYDPADPDSKAAFVKKTRAFMDAFEAKHGTIICRELLEGVVKDTSNDPEKRTEEYYHKRPCREYVEIAAEIVDNYIAEKGLPQ